MRPTATPPWTAPPWCPRTTQACCSPTRAWCSSKRCSSARRSAPTCAPPPARNACAWAASTTTWRTWDAPRATTRSSKCSATSPSATTSRPRPSAWPGGSSPRSSSSPRTSSTSPYIRTTTRRASCGRAWRACPRSASSAWARRTTSGPWATPAPAAPAPKSTWTKARTWPAARIAASASATATATSKSGTSCSCSSIRRPTAPAPRCRAPASTPAWGLSALPPWCRASVPISRPTSSSRSSTSWPTRPRSNTTPTKRPTPRCRSLPTTAAPSPFSSPTRSCPVTKGAATCSGGSSAGPSVLAA